MLPSLPTSTILSFLFWVCTPALFLPLSPPAPPHLIWPHSCANRSSTRPSPGPPSRLTLSSSCRWIVCVPPLCPLLHGPLPGPTQDWLTSDDCLHVAPLFSDLQRPRLWPASRHPQTPFPSQSLLIHTRLCPRCVGSTGDHTVWPPASAASQHPTQGSDFCVTLFFLSRLYISFFLFFFFWCNSHSFLKRKLLTNEGNRSFCKLINWFFKKITVKVILIGEKLEVLHIQASTNSFIEYCVRGSG